MTNRELRMFNLAKQASRMSDYNKFHIGTVLVIKNQILSIGFSSNKTHPVQQYYNKYRPLEGKIIEHKLHSETMAFIKIRYMDIDWNKVEMFNFREKSDGKVANSRPCESCMKLIKELGINKIYYTTDDGYAVENIKN